MTLQGKTWQERRLPGGCPLLPTTAKSFMTKYHYVYKSFEEGGREYIGRRTCDCLPEEDIKYFGSFRDKTFNPTGKIILFTGETRQEIAEIEIELHDFFDVAVNPQFANKVKAVSKGFDATGYFHTKEWKQAQSERMSGEKHPRFGIPWTEEQKRNLSEAMTGEKSHRFGVPHAEEAKKKCSETHLASVHPSSKAVIAIKPNGTELHFVGIHEAARELGINRGNLSNRYLKSGTITKEGNFKGWQFLYENS